MNSTTPAVIDQPHRIYCSILVKEQLEIIF
jgi:hypothetical protein